MVALVIVGLVTPFELVGVPLAPIAALVLGAIAGWWVVKSRMEYGAGEGDAVRSATRAGAAVGIGALLGSILGLAVLATWMGNIPELQTWVQNSEPHPEARIPSEWIAPLGALAGVVVGLIVGVLDLALSTLAGWIAGAVYGRNHAMRV